MQLQIFKNICEKAMNKDKGKLFISDTFLLVMDFIKANVKISVYKK